LRAIIRASPENETPSQVRASVRGGARQFAISTKKNSVGRLLTGNGGFGTSFDLSSHKIEKFMGGPVQESKCARVSQGDKPDGHGSNR
jgi:hypothetical protein